MNVKYGPEASGYVEWIVVDCISDLVGLAYSTREAAEVAQVKWDHVAPYNGPHRILKRSIGPWEELS